MQNVVILVGNIGHTPDVRITQGAARSTNFSLATLPRPPHATRTATASWIPNGTASPASTVRAKTVNIGRE